MLAGRTLQQGLAVLPLPIQIFQLAANPADMIHTSQQVSFVWPDQSCADLSLLIPLPLPLSFANTDNR